MIDAVVAGHLCVDIIPEITETATAASENFMAPGRLTEVGRALLSTGGAVSNTGLSMFRLGLDVRLVARIGDDVIAGVTRNILNAISPHLTEELSIGRGEPSSYTLVINPPGIDRTFLHCTGTNDTFGSEDVSVELLAQARLFHFGYPPLMRRMYADGGDELSALLRKAKSTGVTTSLDMAMPDPTRPSGKADWRRILSLALPHVDVFLPSFEELLYMLRRARYDELDRAVGPAHMLDALEPAEISSLAEETLSLGAKVLVIKLGHRGLYVRTAPALGEMGRAAPAEPANWSGRELWAPCFQVQVLGTVGSGDSTIAGFLAGLLRGQRIEDAATSAVAVGACNVEFADAYSGVRGWEETQARIRAGWNRLDAGIHAPDWAWNTKTQLWHGPNDGA
ncbi:MAG: carbohydrate kinase family protein [Anaerolineae bacterium]